MKKIDKSDLIFHVFMPVILGGIVGLFLKDYTNSIEDFKRNIVVPPILFPIVWSILYLLLGIWFYKYEKEANTSKKVLYYGLLVINLLFSPVLFYYKNITLALIIVIILIIGNIYLFIDSIKINNYGYILIPYLIWLSFACVLMLDLFINNVI